jgi:DNA polymerase-4
MATWIAKSLVKRNMVAHTVRVKFRWADFTTFTRQMSFTVGTDDEAQIYRAGLALFDRHWREGRKIRLIGLGVSGLEEPEVRQFDFGF